MTIEQERNSFLKDLSGKLAAGGISGIIGTSVIYPIDIAKTRIQASQQKGLRAKLNIIRGIGRTGGFRGYYQGLSANLIGVTPEKAIKLTVNDMTRSYLARRQGLSDPADLSPAYGMLAGAMAGMCQVLATNPMEMVKINMQLQSSQKEGGGLLAMIRTMGIGGLYRGTTATLMRDIPFSMIFFQSFASLSELLRSGLKVNQLSLPWVLTAGFGAGCIGAIAATPMDLVKTRYQAEWFASLKDRTKVCRPIGRIWVDTVRMEGVTALFKGSLQRCFIVGPLFGVSLMVFDLQHRHFMKVD